MASSAFAFAPGVLCSRKVEPKDFLPPGGLAFCFPGLAMACCPRGVPFGVVALGLDRWESWFVFVCGQAWPEMVAHSDLLGVLVTSAASYYFN